MNRLLSSGPEKNDGDECLGGAASPHPADRIRVNGGWKPPLRHVNLFCTLALAILGEVQGAEYSQEDAATFLNTYCVTCHGGEEPKGDRRLDVLTGDLANDFATVERWEKVCDQLQMESMPPEEKKQPTFAERRAIVDWIKRQLEQFGAKQAARGGRVVHRRLNRHEYLHTVKDLFGFDEGDFDPTDTFPPEEEQEGFRNNGATLRTSGYLLEEYFAAADEVLERAYDLARVQDPTRRVDWNCLPETFTTIHLATGIGVVERDEPRIYISQSLRSRESDYKAKLFFNEVREGVPHSGWYDIEVMATGVNRCHVYGEDLIPTKERPYFADHKIYFNPDEPMQIAVGQERFQRLSQLRRVRPRFLARAEVPDDHPRWMRFRIWIDQGNSPYLAFANGPGNLTKPQFVTYQLHKYDSSVPEIDPEVRNNLGLRAERDKLYYDRYQGPEVHVLQAKITGPIEQEEKSAAFRLLFDRIGPDVKEVAGSQLRQDFRRVAGRFYRRPVAAAEVEHYALVVDERLCSGLAYAEAAKPVFKAMLCSPDFLFLVEPEQQSSEELTAWQLATRLSYFLSSSTPDVQLRARAEDDSLLEEEVLEEQVERLLTSGKSQRLARHFTEQWLGLNRLGAMPPGMEAFPNYHWFELEPAMKEETWRFFHELLLENLPVTDLVDADFTYANEGLSRLYGLPQMKGDPLRRVALPPGSPRGGILGHASVLTVTSNGVETSPVIRGVWLLEKLFGTPPSPPPPDVPPLEPDIRGAATIRDLLARHREVPSCAHCHEKIDPLGFALEGFDPIGRMRETYPNGVAVDTSGEYRGRKLDGAADIRAYLIEHRHLLVQNVAEKMLTYALGRSLELADRVDFENVVDEWEKRGLGMRDLVALTAKSRPFRTK